MDVETAIRTRRTHKAYGAEPVDRATLDELLELARWAPNHHLTNPWRFRVLGPRTLGAPEGAAGPEAAAQARPRADARRRLGPADRDPARTRRTCSRRRAPPTSSCSARTRAGSPPTGARPPSCATPAGRAAARPRRRTSARSALLHLGPLRQEQAARARAGGGRRRRTSTDAAQRSACESCAPRAVPPPAAPSPRQGQHPDRPAAARHDPADPPAGSPCTSPCSSTAGCCTCSPTLLPRALRPVRRGRDVAPALPRCSTCSPPRWRSRPARAPPGRDGTAVAAPARSRRSRRLRLLYRRARVVTAMLLVPFGSRCRAARVGLLAVWFAEQAISRASRSEPAGGGGGVAYVAHVGGFAFGLLAIRGSCNGASCCRPRGPRRSRR